MEPVALFFQSQGFLPDQAQRINTFFKRITLEKGDYLLEIGQVAKVLGFIEQGQLQYFTPDQDGHERTTYISLQGTFAASLWSFLNEMPSRENIRSISKSTVWIIDKRDLILLKNEIPRFKDFYISMLEWQICCIDKGKTDLITLSADQRFEKLLREDPALFQQVPLQYIASMLGMTPRHLSRLRGKV